MFHRITAYRSRFAEHGFDLQIRSFFTPGFYARRRTFGRIATLYKAIMFGVCTLRMLFILPQAINAHAIIIHRELFPLGSPWMERLLMRLNKHCFYDLDDAIWEPPSNGINQRAFFWNPDRIPTLMRNCSAVVAGSEYIADYARKHTDAVHLIPTGYDDLLASSSIPRSANHTPVVVWIGNLGNAHYLTMIRDALRKVAEKHCFRLRIIGGEDIQTLDFPGVDIEFIAWSRSIEAQALLSADIGVMPLPDQPYERGKCAFKLVQYMACGLPVIASPVGANLSVVTNACGFLADNTAEWVEALTTLICNRDFRTRTGLSAYAHFQSHYSRNVISQQWIKRFQQ